jgi:hypothetical protein
MFAIRLLCEPAAGRPLRRVSYAVNDRTGTCSARHTLTCTTYPFDGFPCAGVPTERIKPIPRTGDRSE